MKTKLKERRLRGLTYTIFRCCEKVDNNTNGVYFLPHNGYPLVTNPLDEQLHLQLTLQFCLNGLPRRSVHHLHSGMAWELTKLPLVSTVDEPETPEVLLRLCPKNYSSYLYSFNQQMSTECNTRSIQLRPSMTKLKTHVNHESKENNELHPEQSVL